MAKLTEKDFENVFSEHKKGRELIGIIQRLGGDKEDYGKAYNLIKFGKRF